MDGPRQKNVTELLADLPQDNSRVAEELLPLVYDDFRAMAERHLRRERADHTLQPTALAHEAYMQLVDQSRVDWKGRAHFMAVAAQAMRRILVDHARARNRLKRGGGAQRIQLEEGVAVVEGRNDEELLAVDDALEKLARLDDRQARIVELRFFAGLTVEQVAEVLSISKRTVEGEWAMARAWLRRELSKGE